jgi:hypothetical protein
VATATFANPWHDEIGRFAPKGTGTKFGATQDEMRSLFEPVRPLVDVLEGAGAKTYLVGGSVRDRLLGIDAKDIDIEVHGLTPDETIALLKERGARVDEVGKAFGVLKVTFDGETHDFSFPRTEVKTGEGHTGFDVTVDPNLGIEQALARRDFTMNALAVDSDGNMVDPFGGVADLKAGVLRHVGPAFSEDPLRILRGVQFAARLGLKFDPETAKLAHDLLPELENISTERVWGEFEKLGGKGVSMEAGVQALKDVGLDTRYGNVHFDGEPNLTGLTGDHRAAVALTAIGVDPRQIGAPNTVSRTMRDVSQALAFTGDQAASRTAARELKYGTFEDAARIAGPNDNVDPRVLTGPLPGLVTGNDVMARGVRGSAIGEVLRAVQQAQDNETIVTREDALAWLDKHATAAIRRSAAFVNPWHDEVGRFAPKGTGRRFEPRGGADAQAQALAEAMATRAELNGGFTFDPRGNLFIKPDPSLPREEHRGAVAVPGHSAIITMEAFQDPTRGKQFIRDYLDQHAETIASQPDIFIGGWHDRAHGEVVLDLSQVRPLDEAIKLGIERGEQAIFDLDSEEDVPTHGTGGRENVKIVDASGQGLVRFSHGRYRGPPPAGAGRNGTSGRPGRLGGQVRGGEAGDRGRHVRGSEFANPWHDEIGQFAPKGTGSTGKGRSSKAEEAAAAKLARAKARKVPKPTEDDVIQGQVDALLAREGLVRAGGDRRGNNTARKKRAKALAAEFGDGTTCACPDCGQRIAADAATAEKLGIDALTQDKILVGTLGGSYKMENLIPTCPPCNQSRGDREGIGVVGDVRQTWGSAERFTRTVVRQHGDAIAQRFQERRSAIMKRKGITWEEHIAENPDALPQDFDRLRRPVGGNFAVDGWTPGEIVTDWLDRVAVNGHAVDHELRVDDPVRVDFPGEQLTLDPWVTDDRVVEVIGGVPPEPLGSHDRAVLNHRPQRSEFGNPWHDEIGQFAPKGTGTNFANIARRADEAEAAGSQISELDLEQAALLDDRLREFGKAMGSDFQNDDGVRLTHHALDQRHGRGTMNGLAATNPDGVVLGAIAYNKNPGDYHIEFLGSTGLVKGVGSQLVIPVMERAAADGAKVTLKVAGTKSAASFWESLGFERDWESATGATMQPADVQAWVANLNREREGVLVGAGAAPEGWDPDDDRWAAHAIELGLMSIVASAAQFMNPWHDEVGRFAPKGTGRKFGKHVSWHVGSNGYEVMHNGKWVRTPEAIKHYGALEVAQHMSPLEARQLREELEGQTMIDLLNDTDVQYKATASLAVLTHDPNLHGKEGFEHLQRQVTFAKEADLGLVMQLYAAEQFASWEHSGVDIALLKEATQAHMRGEIDAASLSRMITEQYGITVESGAVGWFNRAWQISAVSHESTAMQIQIAEQRGLSAADAAMRDYVGDSTLDKANDLTWSMGATINAVTSAHIRNTEEKLTQAPELALPTIHRGLKGEQFTSIQAGDTVQSNPLSSWSFDPNQAEHFATNFIDTQGIVITTEFNPANVLTISDISGMGSLDEREVIMIGEPVKVTRARLPTKPSGWAVIPENVYLIDTPENVDWITREPDEALTASAAKFANPWHDEIGRFAPKGQGSTSGGLDNEEADAEFEEKYGNERRSGDGDCFEVGLHFIHSIPRGEEDRYKLCHGVPEGQGPIEGVRFDHCWIERTDPLPETMTPEQRAMFEQYEMNITVIDKSNGNDVEMPRLLYYQLGSINPRDVRRYTPDEARREAVRTGVYGPWT